MAVIGEVAPLERARELLLDIKERNHKVEHYLDLLIARDLVDDWTTSADVEKTKPHPDLIVAALEKAGGDDAVMIGDSVWDCKAAKAAKVPTIALLTGGFSDKELEEAGAAAVFESIAELRRDLDSTPLG
ncbi:MAG: HAD-IA family hydrolase [Solirubrobacteraceae bacterium]